VLDLEAECLAVPRAELRTALRVSRRALTLALKELVQRPGSSSGACTTDSRRRRRIG
jgi:hypothetical protein